MYILSNFPVFISECDSHTHGTGCQPCSPNCKNAMCDKFTEAIECSDGCIAGKTARDCSQG